MEIYKKDDILYLKITSGLYCNVMKDYTRFDIKPWKPIYRIAGNYVLRYEKYKHTMQMTNNILQKTIDPNYLHYEYSKYLLLQKITNLPHEEHFTERILHDLVQP